MTSNYGVADLRSELKDLYRKAGVKPALPLVFMLTDSQVGASSRLSQHMDHSDRYTSMFMR